MENFHPHISWTYSLKEQRFLFFSDRGFIETQKGTDQLSLWFERASGITRIPAVAGKSFRVIGAPGGGHEREYFICTRGIFLSEDPAVVSGICELLIPQDIGYFEETTPEDIERIIHSWEQKSPKNAVHALRAPVNRIRGIAAILEHELELSAEHEKLLQYLKSSSERLRKLTLHLTRKPYDANKAYTSVVEVVQDAVKTADEYNSYTIHIEADEHRSGLNQRAARCLFNLALNILTTAPSPHAVKVRQLDDAVVAVDFTTKEGMHPPDLNNEHGAPEGSLELFRQVEEALVIRRVDENGRLWHRIVLPATALVPIN